MANRIPPTQRTLKALRDKGLICGVVERFNPYAGQFGIRQDLFGIIDIIALDHSKGVIGVQSCGTAFSDHHRKLTEEKAQECIDWLKTPGASLELWGWRKVKMKLKSGKRSKVDKYEPRVRVYTLEDFGVEDDDPMFG